MSAADSEDERAYAERLQRRLKILKAKFEDGKVFIREGLRVVESLKAVRYAPDGTVDLNTVDGLVRSLALVVEVAHDRDELKKAMSLRDIQSTYFEFIERNFGTFFGEMRKNGMTPHDAGLAFSRDADARKFTLEVLPDFVSTIVEFWEHVGDAVHAHVEDAHDTLKCVYGGDLFPTFTENIASKCGLYADTIILPDPFLRSLWLFERWSDERKVYYFIKHAMNILLYKDLACADVEPPIVIISPDYTALQEHEKNFMFRMGQDDAIVHAGKLFGRAFGSFEEVMDFAKRLDTVDRLLAETRDPKRILFDTEWKSDPRAQIEGAQKGQEAELAGTANPGVLIASHALGRMATCNELLVKCRRLGGSTVIDAQTSWQFFAWKLEYDAERANPELADKSQLHILRGLNALAQSEMQWLGRVPPKALIEVRKVGALPEIRAVLAKGVRELSEARPNNFYRTTDQVFDNIEKALADHKKQLQVLANKKWKFAVTDIGTWLAVGTVEIAAAATGLPFWGLSAVAADQLLDAPKLKDIPQSIRKLAQESRAVHQSPVGLLFKYRNEAE